MPKLALVCLLGSLSGFAATAQSDRNASNSSLVLEQGVAAHAAIDAIYAGFSAGYKALDAASVAGLYTQNAAYLSPDRNILIGRAQIEANFSRFFGRMEQRGDAVAISFRIVQRQVRGDLAYDVGIYTLTITAADASSRQERGKFVAVASRARDGAWVLQVDAFSGLEE
jgi:uncharacterized protein (TIGR02246 family)